MQQNEMFEKNLGLVGFFANMLSQKATPKGYFDFKDFFQEGSIGLWKACHTYKPEKGNTFSTYAGRCIQNEILMYLRREGRKIASATLDAEIPSKDNGLDTETFKDLIEDKFDTEDEVMANDLKDFFYNEANLQFSKKRREHVEEREREIYDLLMQGYKQTEIKVMLGVSQRVVAHHFASIRQRITNGWIYN
ncbi:hypothetical protein COJ96_10960 [Bacillus sp. AFS073361]|uniref:sigma-70 family RNA polymerase sigma factor n=1 Tax=Bacillus sp. AFS073361 TaxID=2033511 RepID=UPI000BF4C1C2|nr:sigma-70 family RNA polymerase sigma factor [Bacillus sp. AFS073361]PFP29416.1 hypothetical protein COJ96_10960 [Bacillus sp. AFS073361]